MALPLLPSATSRTIDAARRFSKPHLSREVRARFRKINAAALADLRETIQRQYHDAAYWASQQGKVDLHDLVIARMSEYRQIIIPWLYELRPLPHASILEIGCGSGSSTVALSEQGARVTGIDIDAAGLAIARERGRFYGVDGIDYRLLNATELTGAFAENQFDLVIFFAALEHMTIDERLRALPAAWSLLRPGAWLVIAEAPNRLWYFDGHTSDMNFFHWLPDEIALAYGRFSPRFAVRRLSETGGKAMAEFRRWGRGVSFHEFDLALGDVRHLRLAPDLEDFRRGQSLIFRLGRYFSRKGRFERMLHAIAPDVPTPFLREYLNLAIRKP
jgi:2-polyprenyl-3-methyl-5-hydroxy-6-metoxy-1,4-benzoquinol methylase